MNQYDSSLARTCLEMSGIKTLYEKNVPANFKVPSLYFPPAVLNPIRSGLNSYRTNYSIYAKVFGKDNRQAAELAETIVQGIMSERCQVHIYNENGTDSGALIKLNPPLSNVIDEGVAQINLEYRIVRALPNDVGVPKANKVGINQNNYT